MPNYYLEQLLQKAQETFPRLRETPPEKFQFAGEDHMGVIAGNNLLEVNEVNGLHTWIKFGFLEDNDDPLSTMEDFAAGLIINIGLNRKSNNYQLAYDKANKMFVSTSSRLTNTDDTHLDYLPPFQFEGEIGYGADTDKLIRTEVLRNVANIEDNHIGNLQPYLQHEQVKFQQFDGIIGYLSDDDFDKYLSKLFVDIEDDYNNIPNNISNMIRTQEQKEKYKALHGMQKDKTILDETSNISKQSQFIVLTALQKFVALESEYLDNLSKLEDIEYTNIITELKRMSRKHVILSDSNGVSPRERVIDVQLFTNKIKERYIKFVKRTKILTVDWNRKNPHNKISDYWAQKQAKHEYRGDSYEGNQNVGDDGSEYANNKATSTMNSGISGKLFAIKSGNPLLDSYFTNTKRVLGSIKEDDEENDDEISNTRHNSTQDTTITNNINITAQKQYTQSDDEKSLFDELVKNIDYQSF